jgi:hypothetical protein
MNTDKQKQQKKDFSFGFIRVDPCSSVAIQSYPFAGRCLLKIGVKRGKW